MAGEWAGAIRWADSQELVFPEPRHCFGCSPRNPAGLGVRFFRDQGAVVCPYRFEERFQGALGVVHGGMQAVLLDEAMCAAVFFNRGTYVLTGELNIRYHEPCPIGTVVVARAEIVEERDRFAVVKGEIRDQDGKLLSSGSGRFYYDRSRGPAGGD